MTENDNKEAYAIVGELVMMSTALDFLLNRVLIAVLHLGEAPLLEPVIATLDPSRKIEILKNRAAHLTGADWKKGVLKFTDRVESVFRQRNIACHTPPLLQEGTWTFQAIAAAKMLKGLAKSESAKAIPLEDFKAAIKIGEAALGDGLNLIENFGRLNVRLPGT